MFLLAEPAMALPKTLVLGWFWPPLGWDSVRARPGAALMDAATRPRPRPRRDLVALGSALRGEAPLPLGPRSVAQEEPLPTALPMKLHCDVPLPLELGNAFRRWEPLLLDLRKANRALRNAVFLPTGLLGKGLCSEVPRPIDLRLGVPLSLELRESLRSKAPRPLELCALFPGWL